MGIAARVVGCHRELENPFSIQAAEPVVPIVAVASLLGYSGSRLECARVGVHPEIAPLDIHLAIIFGTANDASDQAVGAINPIVETERKAVNACLIVSCREAGEKILHDIGATIAIGVLGINDVGSGAD